MNTRTIILLCKLNTEILKFLKVINSRKFLKTFLDVRDEVLWLMLRIQDVKKMKIKNGLSSQKMKYCKKKN